MSDRGFEALRLSLWGAYKVFGDDAVYAVCVNTLTPSAAREKTGPTPTGVIWHDATSDVPAFLRSRFDDGMAEGVGWKLAPMRLFPDRKELALDNDCILWAMPAAIRAFLDADDGLTCAVAEDVVPAFGRFGDLCGTEPRNGGIRGLPAHFDLEAAMRSVLADFPPDLRLTSELDEQGLQTAALRRHGRPVAVTVQEVTICSPFYPHLPHLGTCGAHFVGLNARHIPWNYYDRPADECEAEHWARHRDALYTLTGAPR